MFGIVGVLCLTILLLAGGGAWFMNRFYQSLIEKNQLVVAGVQTELKNVSQAMTMLVEQRRLSVALDISPSSLKVDPYMFEPNKDALLRRIKDALLKTHPEPGTHAYCILEALGLRAFIKDDTASQMKAALTRLVANDDMKGCRTFLEEVIEKL